MAEELITYCEKKILFPELLVEIKQFNLPQYERHEAALRSRNQGQTARESTAQNQLPEDFMFRLARSALEKRLGEKTARKLGSVLEDYAHEGKLLFIIDSVNEVSPKIFDGLWKAIIGFASVTAVECGFVAAIREFAVRPGWDDVGRYIAICAMTDEQVRGFADLYLNPSRKIPRKSERFMEWLRPPGQDMPVIARTPFYLIMLIEWFTNEPASRLLGRQIPKLPILMRGYVRNRLKNKAECSEDEIANVDMTLQGLAFRATWKDAVGTRIQEKELRHDIYPNGLPSDYEKRLDYAEKARLIHRTDDNDSYIHFDHHRLQEYFAAKAWLAVFKSQRVSELEATFSDVQWEDTIRFGVALSEEPHKILDAIYSHVQRRRFQGPGFEISWPIRCTIPDGELVFNSAEGTVEAFWRESQRFYLALRCLAEVDEATTPSPAGDGRLEPDERIKWAEDVLVQGPASEAMVTAEILGEIPRNAAARALQAAFPELYGQRSYSGDVMRYEWGFAIQVQALRALLRQKDANVPEAKSMYREIAKRIPNQLVEAALQGESGVSKYIKRLRLLLRLRLEPLDPLAVSASEVLRGTFADGVKTGLAGLIFLLCLVPACYLVKFLDKIIDPFLEAAWHPISQGFGTLEKMIEKNLYSVLSCVAILLLVWVTFLLVRHIVVSWKDWQDGIRDRILALRGWWIKLVHGRKRVQVFQPQEPDVSPSPRARGKELWQGLRNSRISRVWLAIVAAFVLAPLAVPFVSWAVSILYILTNSPPQAEVSHDYMFLTFTDDLLVWLSGLKSIPLATLLTTALLCWPFLWIIELPRYIVGKSKSGSWRSEVEIQNTFTPGSDLASSLVASGFVAVAALGPSIAFLYMIWKVGHGPYDWFVSAGFEVLRIFPETRFVIVGLFILQTLAGSLFSLMFLIFWANRWSCVKKMRHEEDSGKLLERVQDENEWTVVRIHALRRLPEVDWYLGSSGGQYSGPKGSLPNGSRAGLNYGVAAHWEVRTALMQLQQSTSSSTVRKEIPLILSKLRTEERFVFRQLDRGVAGRSQGDIPYT